MKRFVAIFAGAFLCVAAAYSPDAIKNSAEPMLGALRGVVGTEYLYTAYVPGAGLQFMAFGGGSGEADVPEVVQKAQEVMTALAGTVTELPEGEMLTLVYTDYYDGDSERDLVVSLDPRNPAQIQTFIGGEPQP